MSKPPVSELVIQRSKWNGYNYKGGPSALEFAGKMCCLGFLGKAHGITNFKNYILPFTEIAGCPFWTGFRGSDPPLSRSITWKAATINDSIIPNEEKEDLLIKLFAENGITLSFED